jgi:hypothetical protein
MRSKILPGILAVLALAGTAHAQGTLYDNTTNFLGQAFANGNATNVAGNTITNLVADRITFTGGTGQSILSFTFSVANLNAAAVSARPRVRFWQTDGAGGAPGTLITGFSFNAISFNPGVALFSANIAAGSLVVPGSGDMWAGITYDDNTGVTGATAAQLNNLGQGIFDPPTIGSSNDSHWISAAAGSNFVSNPAGTITSSPFAANPVANYGWKFVAAPEPGSLALLGLGGLGALGVLRRRRRA